MRCIRRDIWICQIVTLVKLSCSAVSARVGSQMLRAKHLVFFSPLSRASAVRLTPRLFTCRSLSSSNTADDLDAKLRADVKMLGQALGNVMKSKDEELYTTVEKLRFYGKDWREGGNFNLDGNPASLGDMVEEVKRHDGNRLLGIARAFTHFLALSNAAEAHHRTRRIRAMISEAGIDTPFISKEDSFHGTVLRLLNEGGRSKDDIYNALCKQHVEIVLTAHPTEVNRRTILQKHQRIKDALVAHDRPDLLEYEKRQIMANLNREILSIWDSDELLREKPTPIDEARSGFAVIENVLWYAVPEYLRKLNDESIHILGKSLPPDFSPIKFSSWMGGDRDGNPNVTPETTRQVSTMSRWSAATLFARDVAELRNELSLKIATEELQKRSNHVAEPYRAVLRDLKNRLDATIDWSKSALTGRPKETTIEPIVHIEELMEPLRLCYDSLVASGYEEIANGNLVDVIRRAAAFGLALTPLDIRQEAPRHEEAMTALTKHMGAGDYGSMNEEEKCEWLCKELATKRPLLPRRRTGHFADFASLGFSPTVCDTLATFEMAANFVEKGSFGAYVISQCRQASDVLAVLLLQQDAGVNPEMRVVPLFETLDDLERSHKVIDKLFSMSEYVERINGKQEIMVGYSDSAKDAGRIAAAWAQYIAQEKMVKVGKEKGIELTFFHGKGGTVGRGGNPAVYRAILAHPPHTINGRFRITEQGEMITQNFEQAAIAERTLDLFTAGVLYESFTARPDPKPEWRKIMDELSKISCDAYRNVVREEPRFVPYFRNATPELELSGLNVGSRPAKRNPKGGVESLRAIPWVFAWTQTRLNLPAWLGVGEALDALLERNPDVLIEMYKEWPWFNTLVDLLEMILSKSELEIAANYDNQLVEDEESRELGKELRAKFKRTQNAIVRITGNEDIATTNPILYRSMIVRNPYVDPLNVIQAELLKRLRKDNDQRNLSDDERRVLQDALLITINGIANGMRNSG